MKKKIIITLGDPAGCGPLITARALSECGVRAAFSVIGERTILERYGVLAAIKRHAEFINVQTAGIKSVQPGTPSKSSGRAALSYLRTAVSLIKKGRIRALVTAPVSKEALKHSLASFSGHTEFLAQQLGVRNVVMLMTAPNVRIALLTRHISLRKVPAKLTSSCIKNTIGLVYTFLQKSCRITHPRIAICSFNPHAGVDTFLEKEEQKIIAVLNTCPFRVYGPYPSDTLFIKRNIAKYDCIVALFHDQAMIPFKLLSFTRGVNLTVGLPLIRTSPAHGTAFDIIKQGKAPMYSSMLAAIRLADKLS